MTGGGKLIVLSDVRAGYGRSEVIRGVSLEVSSGEFIGILGPNGAGKSTLIRVLAGILRPWSGRVSYPFLPPGDFRRELARSLAVLFQERAEKLDIPVDSVVTLGRLPYFNPLQWGPSRRDRELISQALARTGMTALAGRLFSSLSGGERQRALLAMALARGPRALLLDEPVQNLDLRYQVEIFQVLRELNRIQGVGVVAVLHDLNLASRYCTRLILLREGSILAAGAPPELLNDNILEELYGVRIRVFPVPPLGLAALPSGGEV